MAIYWRLVNDVIYRAEVLLLVLDARMPELTRHRELESKLKKSGKRLIYVLNKCDLVRKADVEKMKKEFDDCVFVSSKKRLGGTILLKKILETSQGNEVSVGVIGYPNVGKSSVINMIKGRKAASVSPHAGHTRALQLIKAKGKIRMMDTPGVLPFEEKDILKMVVIGSKNPEHLKEPDYYAMQMIELYPDKFEKYYGIKFKGDAYEFLEEAAVNSKVLIKGGLPDMQRFSRQLLYDWQRGKIHEFLLKHEKHDIH